MTKAELIKAVATATGVSQHHVGEIITSTFDTIANTMAAKGEVEVTGFGKFSRAFRDARTGRNMHTGQPMPIPAKGAAKFTASSVLKKAVA